MYINKAYVSLSPEQQDIAQGLNMATCPIGVEVVEGAVVQWWRVTVVQCKLLSYYELMSSQHPTPSMKV